MTRLPNFQPELRLAERGPDAHPGADRVPPATAWRAMVDSCGAEVMVCDERLVIHYINPAAARELRLDPERTVGASLADVLPPETADAIRFVLGNITAVDQPRTSQAYLHGRNRLSTAYLLPTAPLEPRLYLVVVTSGRHAPAPHDVILTPPAGPARRAALGALAELTEREMEVLRYIGAGLDSRTIAQRLARSLRTVEHHRASIGRKLRAQSLAELIRIAVDAGLTPPEPAPQRTV